MTRKEWETFFELIEKIVDMPMAVSDKIQAVKEAAIECGESAEMNFDEFTSWDFPE